MKLNHSCSELFFKMVELVVNCAGHPRCVYTRGNIIILKCRHCTEEVKTQIAQSVLFFYSCNLWANFTDICHFKLVVACKQIFKNFKNLGILTPMLLLIINWLLALESRYYFVIFYYANHCQFTTFLFILPLQATQ